MVTRTKNLHTFRVTCKDARRVYLVGDFDGWSTTAIEMEQVAPDVWQTRLELDPGTYRFRYYAADGRWLTDFAAFGIVPNRIDGWDSVLYVPDEAQVAQVG